MASITQQIGNYKSGISELPDELKSPGQVVDLKNAIPDITRGCIKRPGSDLVSTIVPTATGKWFPIYTEQDEQYIGQVQTTGVTKIWRCSDGAEIPIDYASVDGTNLAEYLIHTNSDEIQPLTINETTFFANRNKTVAMKTDSVNKTPAIINEAFVALKTIAYGKQYALDIFDPTNHSTVTYNRATAIEADEDVDTSGISGYSNDGKCEGMGRHIVGATSTDSGTSYMAGGTGKSNLRYEMDCRCTPVPQPGSVSSAYDDSYQPHAYLQFGGEGWTTGQTHNYTTKKSGSGTIEITSHVTISSSCNIAKVRPPATSSTADEGIQAAGILGSMKSTLDAISGTGITATVTGNCLHLSRSTPFAVSTPEPQLMTIIGNECNNVAELPTNCRHNYVVKVVNSSDDDDDYYLKFKVPNVGTANQNYFGEGVWEECPAPDIEIEIDKDTMPIKIVREAAGTTYPEGRFRVQTIDYSVRDVGDDNTNPVPSFIGSTLEKMMFFRNRLVVLSKGNVILSKTNDFFNFFSTTAMSESTADPIDLQASSTFPTTLFDGIEVNAGLLIFSSNQQFMLTTDSDALTPSTAKINYLASYNFNPKTTPYSLGTTSGFINSTGKNARIFEMANVQREGEPTVLEQSKLVSKKLPIGLTKPTTSKENSLLLLGALAHNEVWGFRFYNNGEKRVQSAWFRWIMAGSLVHHVILDDVYYQVIVSGDSNTNTYDYTLESIDVKVQDDSTLLTQNSNNYPIYLDRYSEISALPSSAYNATTKKTTFTKPAGYVANYGASFLDRNAGNDFGRYAEGQAVSGSTTQLEFDGDWTGKTLIFGYNNGIVIDIPTIFVTQAAGEKSRSDTRSSLVLHRIHFNFTELGECDIYIGRKGRPQSTLRFTAAETDSYKLNEYPVVEDYIQTIPIYERNTNIDLSITSEDPLPFILNSMNWEGDYNPKYYRRV